MGRGEGEGKEKSKNKKNLFFLPRPPPPRTFSHRILSPILPVCNESKMAANHTKVKNTNSPHQNRLHCRLVLLLDYSIPVCKLPYFILKSITKPASSSSSLAFTPTHPFRKPLNNPSSYRYFMMNAI